MRHKPFFSKKIDNVLIIPKWMKLVVLIKKFPNSYPMFINKKISPSSEYSHTVIIAQRFDKIGVINFEKQGRVNIMNLTHVGKKLADVCEGILNIVCNGDNNHINEEKENGN